MLKDQKYEDVLYFADRYALEHGRVPSNPTVRQDVRGSADTISEALRAYRAEMPQFLSIQHPVMRCFEACDSAERKRRSLLREEATALRDRHLLEDLRKRRWRLVHRQASAAQWLLEREDQLPESLRESVYFVAEQATWAVADAMGDSRERGSDPNAPHQVRTLIKTIMLSLVRREQETTGPLPREADELLTQLHDLSVRAHLTGKTLYVYHPRQGWCDLSVARTHFSVVPRENGPPTPEPRPDETSLLVERLDPPRRAADGAPPIRVATAMLATLVLSIQEAAKMAGITVEALNQRIRRMLEAGQELPFRVPRKLNRELRYSGKFPTVHEVYDAEENGSWLIHDSSVIWLDLYMLIQTWSGKKAPRKRKP